MDTPSNRRTRSSAGSPASDRRSRSLVRSIRGLTRRLGMSETGQDIVELAILAPILIVVVLGIIEFGSILDSQQAMSYLTREGASIASRGTPLDEVLTVTMNNGSEIQLDTRGGAVVSRVRVEGSVPQIEEQVTSPGYVAASHVGSVGDPVGSMSGLNLSEGTTVYVVEVFYERPMLTSITGFFSGTIPDVMYDRAIF